MTPEKKFPYPLTELSPAKRETPENDPLFARSQAFVARWQKAFSFPSPRDKKAFLDAATDYIEKVYFDDPARTYQLLHRGFYVIPRLFIVFGDHPDFERVAECYMRISLFHWQQGTISVDLHPAWADIFFNFLRNPFEFEAYDEIEELVVMFEDGGNPTHCGVRQWQRGFDDSGLCGANTRKNREESALFKMASELENIEDLINMESFNRDWAAICKRFPVESTQPILDTNFMRDFAGKVTVGFPLHFFALCWKHCLVGILEGKPIPAIPFFTHNNLGTEIFIPATMPLDFRRDINLGLLAEFHRAGNKTRMARKSKGAREQMHARNRLVASADAEAKAQGLKGDARYDRIRKLAHLSPDTDEAQIRRMVKAGQRQEADKVR